MTSLSCLRAHTLIERRASGLSTADALHLEAHLSSCEACGTQAHMIAQLRALALRPNATLAPYERERAIESALRTVQAHAPTPERRGWMLPSAMFAGVTALLVLTLHSSLPGPAAAPEHAELSGSTTEAIGGSSKPTDAISGGHVVRGQIEVQGQALHDGAAIADGSELHSELGATLLLAQASVELRAGSRARWNEAQHELLLRSGSVEADVDPSVHQRFVVQTERFSVLVLGTRFEVSERAVSVTRGRVRVLSRQGSELALLGAGERFTLEPVVAAQPDMRAPRASAAREPRPGTDAATLLAEARTQLGDKQLGRARAAIDAALGLSLTPALRAEALSLRADCALLAGDRAAAVSAYLRVARELPQLPAAENALFAAGRIEAERGQHEQASRWLTRYLERYPQGRFVKEAQARLRELSQPTDHAP